MHKANKEMESNPLYSGTGVFYQAMPAVGADGRNIMKLIPVQKVNGQFVQSQTGSYKVDSVQPQRPKTTTNSSDIQIVNTVTLNTSANGQFMKRQNSSPVGEERRHFNGNRMKANSAPQNLTNIVTQARGTLPRLPQRQSLAAKNNLPVTVNSPVLPNGQYLQIPSNAQVKTVSVSELPLAIKKKIVTPTTSATSSSSPTVLFVSPVQTMNQSTPPLRTTSVTSIRSPSKSVNQSPRRPSSTGSSPVSRCGATDSQRPKSPIKWVIEEGDGSLAPCLVPVNSPVTESKTVAERESMQKLNTHETAPPKKAPVSSPSPPKRGPKKDNALMMCNGKVYLLAERGNILPSSPPAAKSCGGVKRALQLVNVPGDPQTSNTSQNSIQIRIPDGSNDIIDLCDDEPQDDTIQVLSSMQTDEDNVIFVSYCPPSSMLGSQKNINEAPVQAKGPERDGTGTLDKGPVQNMVIARDSATVSMNEGALADDPRNVIFVSYNPPDYIYKNRINNAPASKLTPAQDPAKGPVLNGTSKPDERVVLGRGIATLLTNKKRLSIPAAGNCQAGEEAQQILSGHVREPNGTDRPSENMSGPGMEKYGDQKINSRHSASQPVDCVEMHPIVSEVKNVPHVANISDSTGQSAVIGSDSATALWNGSYRNATAADRGRVGGEVHGTRQMLTGHGRDPNTSKPCVATPGPDMERNPKGEGGKKPSGQHAGATAQPMKGVTVHPINVEWMELMENIQHEDSISDGVVVKLEDESHDVEKSKCDHLLRQIFGITSDIRIYLEKVDAARTGSAAKGIPVTASGVMVRAPVVPSGVMVRAPVVPSGVMVRAPSGVMVRAPVTASGVMVRAPVVPSGVMVRAPVVPSGVMVRAPSGVMVHAPVVPSGVMVRAPVVPSGVMVRAPSGVMVRAPSGVMVRAPVVPSGVMVRAPSGVMVRAPVVPSGVMVRAPSGVMVRAPSGVMVRAPVVPSGVMVRAPSGVMVRAPVVPSGVMVRAPSGVMVRAPVVPSGVMVRAPVVPSGVMVRAPSGVMVRAPSGVMVRAPSGVMVHAPLESIQGSTSKLKHWASQDLGGPKQRHSAPVKIETDTTRADGLATQNPTMDVWSPTQRSNAELRTAPLSAVRPGLEIRVHSTNQSSPKDTPCNVEFEQMFGPMEPVDEDLVSSAEENGGLPAAHGTVTNHHKPCCAESSAKPKRKGKPKMCTACPCGMPVASLAKKTPNAKQKKQDPTRQEGGVVTLESGKIRRKRGRPRKSGTVEKEEIAAKVPRMIVEQITLGRTLSLSTEGEQQGHTTGDSPADSNLPATSVGSETNEKEMQERIERLKDLLREKEAALEMYRKNMG